MLRFGNLSWKSSGSRWIDSVIMVLLRIAGLALALASLLCPALLLAHQDEPRSLTPMSASIPASTLASMKTSSAGPSNRKVTNRRLPSGLKISPSASANRPPGRPIITPSIWAPSAAFSRKPIWRPIGCSSMSATRTLSLPAGCCREACGIAYTGIRIMNMSVTGTL